MNSCLYAHLLPNGTPYEYPWKDTKLNENGEWEDDIEPTLAQRLGSLGIWLNNKNSIILSKLCVCGWGFGVLEKFTHQEEIKG